MRNAIIAIAVVLVLGAGAFFIFKKPKSTTSNSSTASNTAPSQSSSTPSSSNNTTPAASTNVINYDGNGFSPSTITVKAGDTVTIKNTSSQPLQLDSDPHPVHTDDPELNVGSVPPGGSQTFTVTKKGTHGYHNHLDSSQTGTIVVQ